MKLSRVGYYTDFIVYPAFIACLGFAGLSSSGMQRSVFWLTLAVASVCLWTLLEYLLHRFALHHIPLLKQMHAHHHDEEKARIGTPSWVSLSVFAALVFLPIWSTSDFLVSSAITVGLMIGYLWYISVHHIVHHWHPGHTSYVYALKRRHALHHHFDETANFGVTSGFWDCVFRTAASSASGSFQHR